MFNLLIKYEISTTDIIYTSLLDVISIFGGYFSIITSIFIATPLTLFGVKGFVQHIVKYLYKKELKRGSYLHEKEEKAIKSIEKKYLTRLSHEKLYFLYDKVEENSMKRSKELPHEI